MYVVNPDVIKLIPADKLFNFTDLIKVAKSPSNRIYLVKIAKVAIPLKNDILMKIN